MSAIGADLAIRAREAGFMFRAVAADSAYGDQDGFRAELSEARLPFVMALKPRRGTWVYGDDAHTPVDAARALAWDGPDDPGDWQAVTRTFGTGMPRPGGPPMPSWALGAATCPAPAARMRQTAIIRRPAWPRSCGSTASATGSSRATSRSRTSSAGPTSRSAPIPPSAATRPWSTARSASAGTHGSITIRHRTSLRGCGQDPAAERGGDQREESEAAGCLSSDGVPEDCRYRAASGYVLLPNGQH